MLRCALIVIVFILVLPLYGISLYAEESRIVNIPLLYPHIYNSPMETKAKIEEPQKIDGTITVGIPREPTLEDVTNQRYLVEYFIDGLLIYQTSGYNDKNQLAFDFELNTKNYRNGTHKITVNFWDKDGPSAIGFKKIIINNKENLE